MPKLPIANYQLHNPGFTILEITIVIFIIVLGMLGLLSMVNQNIQVEYINKNMLIASQLSQEGLEIARNKRDLNWLQGGDWEFSSTTGSRLDIVQAAQGGKYAVDYTGAITAAADINAAGAKLYQDASGFYASAATAAPTGFSRLITVSPTTAAASTTVTCLVQWKRGTNAYNYSAQTVLYNWR